MSISAGARIVRTEARKGFACGFVLNEGEVRRLHDLLIEQIKRTPVAGDYRSLFELKFRNGSVSYLTSLDEVLSQENYGSGSIHRFAMSIRGTAERHEIRTSVEFNNADEDSGAGSDSIRYMILGTDRDWVFVTSSQLEERIAKVKKFVPNQLLRPRSVAFVMLLMGMVLLMIASMVTTTKSKLEYSREFIDNIERQWANGDLTDPIEAALKLERLRLDTSPEADFTPVWYIAPIVLPALVLACGMLYGYVSPPYNFLWGDYIDQYERRRTIGRIIGGGIILAGAMGLAVNFLSRHLGF